MKPDTRMTFLEQLQAHRGGLIRLSTDLYWYGGRGWDGNPGRVCLLLDAVRSAGVRPAASANRAAIATATVATLLLIDGSPQWIWVAEMDAEIVE